MIKKDKKEKKEGIKGEKKKKRGRPRKGLETGKDRPIKEVNRSIKRAMSIIDDAGLYQGSDADNTRLKVAKAYAELLLSNKYSFPTLEQVSSHTGLTVQTVLAKRNEISAMLSKDNSMQNKINLYKEMLTANIIRLALQTNPNHTALKLSAEICGLTEREQQVSFNQSSTIYEIVTESKNEKTDRPAPP